MSWQVKRKPEDFIVREVIDDRIQASWKDKIRQLHGRPPVKKGNDYLWFTLKKTDLPFFDTIDAIAKRLHVGTRSISYAGTKDKRAITYQTVSVPASLEDGVRNLEIPGLETADFRRMNRQVKLGEHRGNRFTITVRNVKKDEKKSMRERLGKIKRSGMINFFGVQRFGSGGRNHVVGKYIVMGDIENAVMSLLTADPPGGPEGVVRARKKLLDSKNFSEAAELFPRKLRYENMITRHLANDPGDYTGALERLPLRLIKLFVHAYQAHLWNMTAYEHSKLTGGQTTIPVPGYMTNLAKYPAVKAMAERMLKNEGIALSDFRLRGTPRLSSRGSERDFLCFPKDLTCVFKNDETNDGKIKAVLGFFLEKGFYGTELIRQIKQAGPGNGPPNYEI